jgi:hypothetical protein
VVVQGGILLEIRYVEEHGFTTGGSLIDLTARKGPVDMVLIEDQNSVV